MREELEAGDWVLCPVCGHVHRLRRATTRGGEATLVYECAGVTHRVGLAGTPHAAPRRVPTSPVDRRSARRVEPHGPAA